MDSNRKQEAVELLQKEARRLMEKRENVDAISIGKYDQIPEHKIRIVTYDLNQELEFVFDRNKDLDKQTHEGDEFYLDMNKEVTDGILYDYFSKTQSKKYFIVKFVDNDHSKNINPNRTSTKSSPILGGHDINSSKTTNGYGTLGSKLNCSINPNSKFIITCSHNLTRKSNGNNVEVYSPSTKNSNGVEHKIGDLFWNKYCNRYDVALVKLDTYGANNILAGIACNKQNLANLSNNVNEGDFVDFCGFHNEGKDLEITSDATYKRIEYGSKDVIEKGFEVETAKPIRKGDSGSLVLVSGKADNKDVCGLIYAMNSKAFYFHKIDIIQEIIENGMPIFKLENFK